MSLPQVSHNVLETERNLDLRVISLLEGTVQTESEEDCAQLGKIKGMDVNIVTLPLHTLNALHQAVSDKRQIREQRTLAVISKVKLNNEQIFAEKAQ